MEELVRVLLEVFSRCPQASFYATNEQPSRGSIFKTKIIEVNRKVIHPSLTNKFFRQHKLLLALFKCNIACFFKISITGTTTLVVGSIVFYPVKTKGFFKRMQSENNLILDSNCNEERRASCKSKSCG